MSRRKRVRKSGDEPGGFALNPEHPFNNLVLSVRRDFNLTPGAAAIWGVLLMNQEHGVPIEKLGIYTPTALNWDVPELESKGLVRQEEGRLFPDCIDNGYTLTFPARTPGANSRPVETSVRRALLGLARGLKMREFEFGLAMPFPEHREAFMRELRHQHRVIYRNTKVHLMAAENQLRWTYMKLGIKYQPEDL